MFIFDTMSAIWSFPPALSIMMMVSLVRPGGSCLPMAPSKRRLVARPRILGPAIERATLITAITMTTASWALCGMR